MIEVVALAAMTFAELRTELSKEWPNNREIRIVCHGHSVPAGYFNTPTVQPFDAYPHLWHRAIQAQYPYAVINVIVTAIGGENSVSGAARFDRDVLALRPDVVLIDYGLNDRAIGLEKSKRAWMSMIQSAQRAGVLLILLTPTPDLNADIRKEDDLLTLHANQIRLLAKTHDVALADPYRHFVRLAQQGRDLKDWMSQSNHPNRAGHEVVVSALMDLLKS